MPIAVRVITYNMLCPAYLRCKVYSLESARPEAYFPRYQTAMNELLKYKPDVLCLQEYPMSPLGLKRHVILPMLQEKGFLIETIARSSQVAKDGVAIAYNSDAFELMAKEGFKLCKSEYLQKTDRVSMMVLLRSKTDPSTELALVTTHLTYAHDRWATGHRAAQMVATMQRYDEWMKEELRRTVHTPAVIAGDFNGERDVVTKYLQTLGYQDTYAKETIPYDRDIITHVDHNGQSLCADHIYVSQEMKIAQPAILLPEHVPANTDFPRPTVKGDLSFYYNVSDHRAVMCDLLL